MRKVDVIIPAYRPGDKLEKLLRRLLEQTVPVNRVIIMNTEEAYWDQERFGSLFEGSPIALTVRHLRREEFDHGRTRHEAIELSDAEVCVCMTQDCIPYDRHLIEKLLEALFQAQDVAAAYARQLPAADCRVIERYTRGFNYPEKDCVKGKADLPVMGIKTFFCSNVCAAYRRELYFSLGGFTRKTIFNEDMIFAGHAVLSGYRIAYAAGAKVIHSHNYSPVQQLRRNFDLAVSQAEHPEIFSGVPSEGEGIRLVSQTAQWLWKSGHALLLPELVLQSGCKYLGYRLGKNYRKLPRARIPRLTMNPAYWGEGDGEGVKDAGEADRNASGEIRAASSFPSGKEDESLTL